MRVRVGEVVCARNGDDDAAWASPARRAAHWWSASAACTPRMITTRQRRSPTTRCGLSDIDVSRNVKVDGGRAGTREAPPAPHRATRGERPHHPCDEWPPAPGSGRKRRSSEDDGLGPLRDGPRCAHTAACAPVEWPTSTARGRSVTVSHSAMTSATSATVDGNREVRRSPKPGTSSRCTRVHALQARRSAPEDPTRSVRARTPAGGPWRAAHRHEGYGRVGNRPPASAPRPARARYRAPGRGRAGRAAR